LIVLNFRITECHVLFKNINFFDNSIILPPKPKSKN